MDWLGDPVLHFDATGRLARCNPTAYEVFGARLRIGATWDTVVEALAPGSTDLARSGVPAMLRAEGYWRGQTKLADAHGHAERYAATIAPEQALDDATPEGDEGRPGGFVVVRQDNVLFQFAA